MTKAEIRERIENTAKNQCEGIKAVNELLNVVSMSDDTAVLAAILHTLNGNICDTMNNLALILCEMLTEELKEAPEKAPEPKKGDHDINCSVFNCLCNTCIRDNSHDATDRACCDKHGFRVCHVTECPDYVKEG